MLSPLVILRSRSQVSGGVGEKANWYTPRSHTILCLNPLIFTYQADSSYAPNVQSVKPRLPSVFDPVSYDDGHCESCRSGMALNEILFRT